MPSFIIIGYVWEIFGREAFLPPPICEQPRKDSSWIELRMCSCSFFWVKVPSYVLICAKVFLESFQNCCFQECSVKLRDRSHMMSTHRSRGGRSVTFWFIWYFNQIYCFFWHWGEGGVKFLYFWADLTCEWSQTCYTFQYKYYGKCHKKTAQEELQKMSVSYISKTFA